jgi:hypothetical protein
MVGALVPRKPRAGYIAWISFARDSIGWSGDSPMSPCLLIVDLNCTPFVEILKAVWFTFARVSKTGFSII